MNDFWIISAGILVAVNCSLLGVYLVLRKMAMVGDAISHAVLPGIVIAYFIAESRSSLAMLLGAAVFGLLTTVLIEVFYRRLRVQSDASIGIVFTWLFAIGVILVSLFAGNIDIDQECVLYGEIAYVPFDTWSLAGINMGPVSVWLSGVNLLLILALIYFGYRGLFITSFDAPYAVALGIATGVWHYLLMSAVSLTVVFSFNSVGAILVVAFLVIPAATAYLICKKLKPMLFWAAGIGALSAVAGYYLAAWWDASIAGSMAVAAGVIFTIVLLYSILRRGKPHLSKTRFSDSTFTRT